MEFILIYSIIVSIFFVIWILFIIRMYNKLDE